MDSALQLRPEIQSIDNHAMNSYILIQISSQKNICILTQTYPI